MNKILKAIGQGTIVYPLLFFAFVFYGIGSIYEIIYEHLKNIF